MYGQENDNEELLSDEPLERTHHRACRPGPSQGSGKSLRWVCSGALGKKGSLMKIQFEFMKATMIGWQCPHCLVIKPFIEGAVMHEQAIEDNLGHCPQAVSELKEETQ